jgi:hypothetical protein
VDVDHPPDHANGRGHEHMIADVIALKLGARATRVPMRDLGHGARRHYRRGYR